MYRNEQGSSLLLVLVAITILTVMMTGLYTVSNRSLTETMQYDDGTKALYNAKSVMSAIYDQTKSLWLLDSENGFKDTSTAEKYMRELADNVKKLSVLSNLPSGTTFSIVAPDRDPYNDFSLDEQNQSNLYQEYFVTVTSTVNGVTRNLYDKFVISGTIEALNYALYSTGNLVMAGSPEIDGSISIDKGIYIDNEPWAASGNFDFSKEPYGYEPYVHPKFSSGSSIASGTGFYSYSSYDNYGQDSVPRLDFFDSSQIADPQIISPKELNSYIDGSPVVLQPQAVLADHYVADAVANAQRTLYAEVYPNYQQHDVSWLHDGEYISFLDPNRNKGTFDYKKVQPTSQHPLNGPLPIYIDGNLTLEPGSSLTLNQPLFVNGDLTVGSSDGGAYITSTAPIYVTGSTTIINPPSTTSRLLILSDGAITLQRNTNTPPTSPTTIDAFLASDSNVELMGMTSFYHIIGGVAGNNIGFDSTVGAKQDVDWSGYLESGDKNDVTPRLRITFDPVYAASPMASQPLLQTPILQAKPQPTTTLSTGWPTS